MTLLFSRCSLIILAKIGCLRGGFVNKVENFRVKMKIFLEKFGGLLELLYLCTRFRQKMTMSMKKEFFERFT